MEYYRIYPEHDMLHGDNPCTKYNDIRHPLKVQCYLFKRKVV